MKLTNLYYKNKIITQAKTFFSDKKQRKFTVFLIKHMIIILEGKQKYLRLKPINTEKYRRVIHFLIAKKIILKIRSYCYPESIFRRYPISKDMLQRLKDFYQHMIFKPIKQEYPERIWEYNGTYKKDVALSYKIDHYFRDF